ncbi:TPA: site-specific DNA-methyltransferase [Staphylococcus aureus]|nr:site-specific DNA-methyltransferase [Staphylococcus aureus]
MSANILDEISEILSGIEKYWINEKLAKQIIIEDLRNNDTKLISKLLANKSINETYVQDIDGYKIFDKESLISLLRYKNYWQDSYTKYANKIGLTVEGKYLNYNSDVVLDFPFKDCVFEGGMTKEDSILKNNEKFYNEVIAKEEIDTLLSPKAFTKVKKYDKNGQHDIKSIESTDNLIIKGNNLFSLFSLKKVYKKKVKSIIIDPPYYFNKTKAADSFDYNSNFNFSTWLIFMKNRLQTARDLLREDGIIAIMIGIDAYEYLKVLADEIFCSDTKNNYIGTITWRKSDNQSNIGTFSNVIDYILLYRKTSNATLNRIPLSEKAKNEYSYEDNNGKFRRGILLHKTRGRYYYELKTKMGTTLNGPWMKTKEEIEKLDNEGKIYWTTRGDGQPYVKIYLDDTKGQIPNDFWGIEFGTNQRGANEINKLFNKRVFNFAKPEKLIKSLVDITSSQNDIVLDFFMGSATTQAVAHKMNRQYIGVEQMDYINTVSIPRLQKVIEGEQGGVSTDLDWQGGGSFVYVELAKENQEIVESLINCGTKEELSQRIDKLLNDGVLNYEVDFDKFTSTKKEFHELELEDQKEVLIRLLDSNQLYVNYSDIEDSAYNFTEDEIAFNHSFYGGE